MSQDSERGEIALTALGSDFGHGDLVRNPMNHDEDDDDRTLRGGLRSEASRRYHNGGWGESESGLDACIRRSGGSRSSYVAGCSLFVNLIFVAVIVSLASSSGYSPSSSEDGSSAGSESPPEELVTTTLGAVAADEPRCSALGASVLDDGGGAVDAAVATA